ncbi:MAG: hypothetical protein NT027_18165 [Proteobacteria bacterium]|nr:hypothetical protein [Pseudomonadota bacterium]
MRTQIQFKALSSGIGIGQLRQPSQKSSHRIRPIVVNNLPDVAGAPAISHELHDLRRQEINIRQHAMNDQPSVIPANERANTQPEGIADNLSVENSKSVARPSGNHMIYRIVRHLVGWGFDAMMVAMTLVMASLFASMAWRLGLGEQNASDPFLAVKFLISLLKKFGAPVFTMGLVCSIILYWSISRLIMGKTVGTYLKA